MPFRALKPISLAVIKIKKKHNQFIIFTQSQLDDSVCSVLCQETWVQGLLYHLWRDLRLFHFFIGRVGSEDTAGLGWLSLPPPRAHGPTPGCAACQLGNQRLRFPQFTVSAWGLEASSSLGFQHRPQCLTHTWCSLNAFCVDTCWTDAT